MSCLPKPVLRWHEKRQGIRTIVIALGFALFNSSAIMFWRGRRQKAYETFFREHDDEAFFKDLEKWGYIKGFK